MKFETIVETINRDIIDVKAMFEPVMKIIKWIKTKLK